ncbi:hypothetical protein RSOLAG1IB_05086 [Rhizoctonia solani AG-1 IB]|uniref:F-box domain-containing protein n=1 Tax=Thanatephorus cucumeris (strain AG1-IB / isolate 7/3/14) TaxID=1108050 RepID=A0A0B7G0U2_THACB|nr:hypothetical protein RSOLAG1IB_05086 [Rhizoctonia solani AG-1 IB]
MSTQCSPSHGSNDPKRFEFGNLPNELVVRILEYCGYADLLRFSQTCRNYYLLVKSSARLRLQIEIGANGLKWPRRWLAAGGQSQELLEKLVQCRDDWLDLRLTAGECLPRTTSGQRFTLWELRRGVFVSAFSIGEHRHLEADALKMIALDSPVTEWTLKFNTTFHELTIDPSQDLLVLAVTQTISLDSHHLDISLRSLGTGLAHPSARLGVIPFQAPFSLSPHHIYSTISLSVTNEILLVSLIANTTELYSNVLVIDWKAGVLLLQTSWRPGLCSAILLHNDCLLVFEAIISNVGEMAEALTGRPDSLGLLVYDRIRTPEAYEQNTIQSRVRLPNKPFRKECMKFEFPAFETNVWILASDFLARAAPISDYALDHTSDFAPDYAARTLSLSMRIISAESAANILIFVDSAKLLTHLERAEAEGLTSIPWAAWGEYSTRWIYYESEPNPWINWLHGTRYVLGRQVIDEQNSGDDIKYIGIADFHSPAVRRFASRREDQYILPLPEHEIKRREIIGSGQWAFFGNYSDRILEAGVLAVDIVDTETPTVLRGLSPEPIISRLPYRLVVARPNFMVSECSDWMIDENRIIGVGPNPITGQFGDLITIQSLRGGSYSTPYNPPSSSTVVKTIHSWD